MSRAEELFAAELELRRSAINYSETHNVKAEANTKEEARKRLRDAAVAYTNTAEDLDVLVFPEEP